MIEYVPFVLGLLCGVVVLSGFAATALRAEYRFWPAGSDERKRRLYLVCSRGLFVCFFATAILDTGSVALPPWARIAGGGVAFFASGLLTKSAADLGEAETEGRVGELRTDGLYRYTRNPQNVAYLLLFWALTVASASILVGTLAGVFTVWLVSQSLVEEPWLREQYDGYEAYAEEVPRFVGVRSLRRGVRDVRSSSGDADS
jgi:protein-S-isoprenylcysteine O-methyltransferase Ste14